MDNYNVALAIVSVAHSLFFEMQMLSPEEQIEFEGVCFGTPELVQRFLDFITDFQSVADFTYEIGETTCHIGTTEDNEKAEGAKWRFLDDKGNWMLNIDIINFEKSLTKKIAEQFLYEEPSSEEPSEDDEWI